MTLGICDELAVRSLNLCAGEDGLHRAYEAIVAALARRGVTLSLTSNGRTEPDLGRLHAEMTGAPGMGADLRLRAWPLPKRVPGPGAPSLNH
jgi:hypothetical protein